MNRYFYKLAMVTMVLILACSQIQGSTLNTSFSVAGVSNIFGAGHATVPSDGQLPPGVNFTAGPNTFVTFSSVTGLVAIVLGDKS